MINVPKLVKFPLIKLYSLKKMLKYNNILLSFRGLVMVLTKAFSNIIKSTNRMDTNASNHMVVKYQKN